MLFILLFHNLRFTTWPILLNSLPILRPLGSFGSHSPEEEDMLEALQSLLLESLSELSLLLLLTEEYPAHLLADLLALTFLATLQKYFAVLVLLATLTSILFCFLKAFSSFTSFFSEAREHDQQPYIYFTRLIPRLFSIISASNNPSALWGTYLLGGILAFLQREQHH